MIFFNACCNIEVRQIIRKLNEWESADKINELLWVTNHIMAGSGFQVRGGNNLYQKLSINMKPKTYQLWSTKPRCRIRTQANIMFTCKNGRENETSFCSINLQRKMTITIIVRHQANIRTCFHSLLFINMIIFLLASITNSDCGWPWYSTH